MNWFRRATISAVRKPGKTVVFFLLIFILGNLIAGAVSIQQAIYNTDQALRVQAGAVATIDMDYDRMNREGLSGDEINKIQNEITCTLDTVRQVGALPNVSYYDYSLAVNFKSNLKTKDDYIPVLKSTNLSEMADLRENKIRMVAGRTFSQQELDNFIPVTVISAQLAEMNQLSIGSKIPVFQRYYIDESLEGEQYFAEENIAETHTYEFEVIGIYELTNPEIQLELGAFGSAGLGAQGTTLYTTDITARTINKRQQEAFQKYYSAEKASVDDVYFNVYFVLNEPLEMENFQKDATLLLPDYYKITLVSDFYKPLIAPIRSMKTITDMLLYLSSGAVVIILGLLLVLFLRDRRHELGIYLSLGEKKKKVVSQIMLEVLSVAIVAISLSLFTGNLLSAAISEQMIEQQVIAEQERLDDAVYSGQPVQNEFSSLNDMGYSKSVSSEDIIENYTVTLNGLTVLLFYAIGIGTIILSTVLPTVYILHLNPKKILK